MSDFDLAYVQSREARIEQLERDLAAANSAMEALREDSIHKVMSATDEQITAAIRMDGRDPDDTAKITKQAVEIAMLKVDLAAANAKIDTLDCSLRECNGTLHCRHHSPCLKCKLDAATKRANEAEADAKRWRKCIELGRFPMRSKPFHTAPLIGGEWYFRIGGLSINFNSANEAIDEAMNG